MQIAVCCLLSITTVLLILPNRSEGRLWCKPCYGEECDIEPQEGCPFGIVRDHCGRRVCAKGPGEMCGGPNKLYGKCGEGMHCKCERCNGCSLITFICHNNQYMCIE